MMRIMGKKQVLLLISTLFGIALLGIMIWLARPMAILARIKALGAGGIIGLGRSSISGGLQQGIVGLAGTALVVSGIALVGMSRRATWASRFLQPSCGTP